MALQYHFTVCIYCTYMCKLWLITTICTKINCSNVGQEYGFVALKRVVFIVLIEDIPNGTHALKLLTPPDFNFLAYFP
jgi:hypothetical protein